MILSCEGESIRFEERFRGGDRGGHAVGGSLTRDV